ncbi:MAG: fluoride efflux transporter CrcB [Proteobacteria bacterium]|nr:fluoride efflux transporter CrcB [Pseudomonadota bacterium]MBS0574654.1 fluoride efflux transporter CrcB [Pseudomonadota bacterium]
MIQTMLTVALGGAIGASARYLTSVATMRLMGGGFPWATVFVNVAGSFFMGFLVVLFAHRGLTRHAPFVMTGILGGFTTFSAFSLDTVSLWQRGASGAAAVYVVGSVVLSIAGLFAGMAVARVVVA